MNKMLLLFAALIALHATAREISSDEAGRAASAWLRRDNAPLGAAIASADVAEVRTCSEGDTPLFHIVRMTGGGVVVTSSESGVTPVIAFLDAGDIGGSDGNPLWEILNADMSNRIARVKAVRAEEATDGKRLRAGAGSEPFAAEEAAWAGLLDEGGRQKAGGISDASGISDLRVPALLSTRWDQGNGAGNYYTPTNAAGSADNYPCGCIALAGAQIAYFWRFPTEARPQVTRTCYISGVENTFTTLGGTYDWSNMPPLDFYASQLSLVKRQAVGRLCYDFGVATRMNWGPGGSGTVSAFLAEAFTDVFGYASAKSYLHFDGNVIPDKLVEKAVLANLDAGCPVAVSIYGHSVAADGYGYVSDTLYTHLNFGWGGLANAWYNLPDVSDDSTGYTSTVLDQVVYNIFPNATGELLTGRVLDSDGDPVPGATVTATNGLSTVTGTTNGRGIYALHVAGGRSWTVTATYGADSGSVTVTVTESKQASLTRTDQGCMVSYPGSIGNSWGNDIELGVDVPAGGSTIDDGQGGYAAWAAANGLGEPDAVTDGQPNLIRYAFDVPSEPFSPITGIFFQDGKPAVTFMSLVNTDGVTVRVLSSTNLLDWAAAEEYDFPAPEYNGLIFNHTDPQRFYMLKAE